MEVWEDLGEATGRAKRIFVEHILLKMASNNRLDVVSVNNKENNTVDHVENSEDDLLFSSSVLSESMKEEVFKAMLAPQDEDVISDGAEDVQDEFDLVVEGVEDMRIVAGLPASPTAHASSTSSTSINSSSDETKSPSLQEQLFSFVLEDTTWDLSIHEAPRSLIRDLKVVFRDALKQHKFNPADFKVVPTVQKTLLSTLAVNEETAKIKDDCLERFVRLAERFAEATKAKGYWADFTDPCCGLPMLSNGNTVYPDINGLVRLRNFPTFAAGGCHVALHPSWGECMYPATMFTNAPMDVVVKIVESILP